MAAQSEALLPIPEPAGGYKTLRVLGWLSAGVAVASLGILLGRELRSRYKFNRRTPYDFFSHAEPEPEQTDDFGVGI